MPYFTQKIVVVEARRIETVDDIPAVMGWMQAYRSGIMRNSTQIYIPGPHGTKTANVGQWVTRVNHDEFVALDPDDFHAGHDAI